MNGNFVSKGLGPSSRKEVVRNGSVTFEWFVNNRYLPLKEADWREETGGVIPYPILADLQDDGDLVGGQQ